MESRLVIGPLAERLVGNRGEKDKIRIWGNGRSVQPFFTFEFSGVTEQSRAHGWTREKVEGKVLKMN